MLARKPWLIPIAALLLVRTLFFWQVASDPRFEFPQGDAAIYHEWGSQWAQGEEYAPEASGQPFWRAPIYPLFVSLVYRLTGPNPIGLAAVQLALGWLAISGLIYFAWQRHGSRTAWLTAALSVAHGPALFMEACLLPVALATPLLIWTGLGVLRLLAGPLAKSTPDSSTRPENAPKRPLIVAGLCAGLTVATRANLFFLLPLAAFFVWRRAGLRTAVLLLSMAGLPLLVTSSWNLARSSEFVVVAANGPFNFQFAYGPEAGPSFATANPLWGDPVNQRRIAIEAMAEEVGRKPETITSRAVSRYWGGQAWDWILDHPGTALRQAAEKFLAVFTWRDLAIVMPISASDPWVWLLVVLCFPFPLLVLLASCGAWKQLDARRAWWLVLLPVVVGAVLSFSYTRFRIPAVPWLAFAAAIGVMRLGELRSQPKHALFAVALAILMIALSWTPWLDAKQRAAAPWNASNSQGWWMSGQALEARYRATPRGTTPDTAILDQAKSCYERADELDPHDPKARRAIAMQLLLLRGHKLDAWVTMNDLARDFPRNGSVLSELAAFEWLGFGPQGSNPSRAVELFSRAEALGQLRSNHLPEYAQSLHAMARREEAVRVLQSALALPIWPPDRRAHLETLLRQWQD